jgi:hypothetical protein
MPATKRRRTGFWAKRSAWALVAAGLTAIVPAPVALSAGRSTSVDLGLQAPNLIAPNQLVGEWLTIVRVNGRPQPVRLVIQRIEPGKTAGKLIYSSPRRCNVDLEYGGPDGDRHIFYMIPFTNCFDYKKTDYVAVWLADPAFDAGGGSKQHAGTGATDSADTAPSGTSLVPRIQGVERVRYAVIMDDKQTETGLLTRQ